MNEIINTSSKLITTVGSVIFIFGLIGNILNIYVFTIWSYPRRIGNLNNIPQISNGPLYLLVSSIVNIIIILYPLLTRILFDGFQYKVTYSNVWILCKLRYYILHTFDILSLTCVCMAIFDRYLITSRQVHVRQMNPTRKQTYAILLSIISLNALHGIPLAVYFNVSNTGECIVQSSIYLYYYLFVFQVFLHGILPVTFLTIFGILTLKQFKLIRGTNNPINHLHSDKQLSRMLLLMSIAIVLSSIPYSIEQFYYVIISHSNESQSSHVFLLHVISSILFYTNSGCCFYIFYVSTPNFRKQLQKLIIGNRVILHPFHNQVNIVTIAPNSQH